LLRLSTIGRWRSADSFMEIPNSAGAYCELDGRESMDIETKAESWNPGKHFPISWGYGASVDRRSSVRRSLDAKSGYLLGIIRLV
jgi:hypothetical protein